MVFWSIVLAIVALVLALCYYKRPTGEHFLKHGVPYGKYVLLTGKLWPPSLRFRTITDMQLDVYNTDTSARYVGVHEVGTPAVVLRDPELIKSVWIKNFDHFPERGPTALESDPLFGKNLGNLNGVRWKETRTLLTPSFTSNKLRGMFALMSECGAEFVDTLLARPEKTLDLKDAFTRCTNDILARCAFGLAVNTMKDPENQFFRNARGASIGPGFALKITLIRALPAVAKLLNIRLFSKSSTEFFTGVTRDVIRSREENGIVRPDMMQLMLENREKLGLTIEEITAHAFGFFVGGFDTTATIMAFAAYEIGINPEIQERLQKEIDDALEKHGGQFSYEALSELVYLDAVVNETLRHYPGTAAAERVCVKRFELPPTKPGAKPLTVEPGWSLSLPIYALHHDPRYFKEPEKFKPERFIEQGQEILSSGAFIPFGMGPRMCIANRFAVLEVKALLLHLLARCELKPCAKTSVPLKLAKDNMSMRPENGYWFEVRARSNPHPLIGRTVSDGINK